MAETFADLGLRTALVDAADAVGYAAPSPLQAAAVPVLRRGGNVVLDASPGAGVTAAYALGLLDRLAEEEAATGPAEPARPRMLVLASTPEAADRLAVSIARFARAVGLRVTALAPGWPGLDAGVDVAIAATDALLAAVRTSRLKLDAVRAVVVDALAQQLELGGSEPVETLVGSLPSEAQRVIVSGRFPDVVERFVEAHVRRALHIPPRPAAGEAPAGAAAEVAGATLGYVVVSAAADDRPEAAAMVLRSRGGEEPAVLFCRTAARAARLADALELRGFTARVQPTDTEPGRVTVGAGIGAADSEAADGAVISHDVPFDEQTLRARHADAGGHVIVAPREVPHLRRIAARAGLALSATTPPAPERAAAGLDAFRGRLRRAAQEEDLGAQWLVLEPLLEDFTAAELAAAASALLRKREPVAEPGAAVTPPPPGRRRAPRPEMATPTGPAPPAWMRLFMSVGRRDGVGPGDVVGAITGETNARGEQVGRIEIKDTFSIVEVAREVAEDVIRAMNGITLKGRSLRVDYDRKASRGGGGRGRSPRRSSS